MVSTTFTPFPSGSVVQIPLSVSDRGGCSVDLWAWQGWKTGHGHEQRVVVGIFPLTNSIVRDDVCIYDFQTRYKIIVC